MKKFFLIFFLAIVLFPLSKMIFINSNSFIKSSIPRVIHRIWIPFDPNNPEIPERYKEMDILLKKLHPNWKFVEWNEEKILNFIYHYYPDSYPTYISYDVPVKRHDVARYLILKEFGGVFIQHSFVFQKNIEPLLGKNKLLFSTKMPNKDRADELANNFIASTADHPFWSILIKNLQKSANVKEVMSATGPFILTNSLKEYQKKHNDFSVKVLNYKYLFPFYFFDKNKPEIKENCIEAKDIKQCFKLFPDVYAYCPWTSSWTNEQYQQAKVNLSLLDPKHKQHLYTKLFVMNLNISKDRWEEISNKLNNLGVEFERFPAVYGYNVLITDLDTGISFTGLDVKNKKNHLPKEKDFEVKCDNGVNDPITVTLKGDEGRLMAGNIGVWCTKILIREEIIKHKYNHTIIMEDDFSPNTDNFVKNINKFIMALPKNYDMAYLHYYIKDPLKLISTENNLVLTHTKKSEWYGDWAHMISYEGAIKLNSGYKFMGNSDDYSRKLAKGKIIKPNINSFNVYFAKHNFSALPASEYTGHNKNSISTKMGCRDFHPSNPEDCE